MPQYALPIANYGTTGWIESAGDGDGDWFDELDEGFGPGRGSGSGPDDGVTCWKHVNVTVDVEPISTRLSAVSDPGVLTGHVVRTRSRAHRLGGGGIAWVSVRVRLLQDGYLIAEKTWNNIGTAWTTRSIELTSAQAGLITDYSSLRIETKAFGDGAIRRNDCYESAHELEVPSPAVPPPLPEEEKKRAFGIPLGLAIRKQIANTYIFRVKHGQQERYDYVVPGDPKSEEQQHNRGILRLAVQRWKSLSEGEQWEWDEWAKEISARASGFNLFCGRYLRDYMAWYNGL